MCEIKASDISTQPKVEKPSENFDPDKRVDSKNPEMDNKDIHSENKQESYDPDSRVLKETKEIEEPRGGRYRDLRDISNGIYKEPQEEVHHMPADSTYDLPRDDKPAIIMEKKDHQQTASWGSSYDAMEYRDAQKQLIDEGKYREALQMDIDDIRDKFGNKYDKEIDDMLKYVDKLEEEGNV